MYALVSEDRSYPECASKRHLSFITKYKPEKDSWEDVISFDLGGSRLRVVSNFGDGDCGAGKIHTRARNFEETRRPRARARAFARARVYFARPTITIAKIRDYSQSRCQGRNLCCSQRQVYLFS